MSQKITAEMTVQQALSLVAQGKATMEEYLKWDAARVASIRAEKGGHNGRLSVKTSLKGGVSLYGLQRFPVTFSVPWEMRLRPTSDRSCELTCSIGAEFSSALLAAIARANGSGFFIRRHLAAEGAAFARDIERKFAS